MNDLEVLFEEFNKYPRRDECLKEIDDITTEMMYITTSEYKDRILDKGIGKSGIYRDVMINLLHSAAENDIDTKQLVGDVLRGFYYQSDFDKRANIKEFNEISKILDP